MNGMALLMLFGAKSMKISKSEMQFELSSVNLKHRESFKCLMAHKENLKTFLENSKQVDIEEEHLKALGPSSGALVTNEDNPKKVDILLVTMELKKVVLGRKSLRAIEKRS